MNLTTVEFTKRNILFGVKIADLLSDDEMKTALTWFPTEHAVVVFVIDFLDYRYIFGNDLQPRDVGLQHVPSVFEVMVKAADRLRRLMRLVNVHQVSGFRYTKTTVFIIATQGVPANERPSNV